MQLIQTKMDKKQISKYMMWFLMVAAVVFAIAGWYYTGGPQKLEGFISEGAKENMFGAVAGSCSVGTCG